MRYPCTAQDAHCGTQHRTRRGPRGSTAFHTAQGAAHADLRHFIPHEIRPAVCKRHPKAAACGPWSVRTRFATIANRPMMPHHPHAAGLTSACIIHPINPQIKNRPGPKRIPAGQPMRLMSLAERRSVHDARSDGVSAVSATPTRQNTRRPPRAHPQHGTRPHPRPPAHRRPRPRGLKALTARRCRRS